MPDSDRDHDRGSDPQDWCRCCSGVVRDPHDRRPPPICPDCGKPLYVYRPRPDADKRHEFARWL